ncbi:U2 small nuclear ribonucleoprotein Aprime [Diplonema papillatum]|nr:U2 small nuclear ribonucleoprotein Aprime [Diplonema papillatum]
MDLNLDRCVEQYGSHVATQYLDGIAGLIDRDVQLVGMQEAYGRFAVLKELAKLFKWYEPWDTTARVMEGNKGDVRGVLRWSYKGVEIEDVITTEPESGRIAVIQRQRLQGGAPADARSYNAALQALLGVLKAGADGGEFAQSPRKRNCGDPFYTSVLRKRGPLGGTLSSTYPRAAGLSATDGLPPSVNPLSQTAASFSRHAASAYVPPPVSQRVPLDYSFKEITMLKHLFFVEPRSGIAHKDRTPPEPKVPVQPEKPREIEPIPEQLMMIKARSREKESEVAYSWDRSEQARNALVEELMKEEVAPVPGLITAASTNQARHLRYSACAVKLSNNLLTDATHLSKCLKLILHHSVTMLSFLDLSCNNIDKLPSDLNDFPLQVLYLHSNNIKSFEEVKKLANVTTLRSLTLWNNPLENKASGNYKMMCLGILCPGFKGHTTLRKLDHVVISRQDAHNCKMFREFTVVAAENNKERSRGAL